MIPKIIHQCWFGTYDDRICKFGDTIRKFHEPSDGWEHKIWMEDTIIKLGFKRRNLREHYRSWAQLANVVRLEVVYQQGGIFLDADMECHKPFDPLLEYEAWVPDKIGGHYCIAAFGAVPGHPWVKWQLDKIYEYHDGRAGILSEITDAAPMEGVTILPVDTFFPYHWNDPADKRKITENTFADHKWDKTWWTHKDHAAAK